MRALSDRQLGIAMRALLIAVAVAFAALLVLIDLIRINAELTLPQFAGYGMPVYLGVFVGFVPIYVAIWQFWRMAGTFAVNRSVDAILLRRIRIVRNCALTVAGWFTIGLLLFFAVFRLVGPPPIVAWAFIEFTTLSIAAVSTYVMRLLEQH